MPVVAVRLGKSAGSRFSRGLACPKPGTADQVRNLWRIFPAKQNYVEQLGSVYWTSADQAGVEYYRQIWVAVKLECCNTIVVQNEQLLVLNPGVSDIPEVCMALADVFVTSENSAQEYITYKAPEYASMNPPSSGILCILAAQERLLWSLCSASIRGKQSG